MAIALTLFISLINHALIARRFATEYNQVYLRVGEKLMRDDPPRRFNRWPESQHGIDERGTTPIDPGVFAAE